ncbi:hypothetical protein [Aquimarina sp. MAR_2010_214]|uniref:hypothetical protein n=1 Tax=Aquimarina sp. MAR_2010_214 TaxID=1250026 RepID=UPI000C705FDB|nr:hypothetical protein [Aquimarina sp. MAR_2010_214]
MKKPTHRSTFFALFLALISSLFFLHSCQQDSAIEVLEEEEYLRKIETLETKVKDLEEKLGQEKSRRRKPKNIISFTQAQRIYKNYDDRADLISEVVNTDSNGTSFKPTRSMFYEISELRSYLSYVDELSQKSGVKTTGLRFYFALYSDTYVSSSGSNKNARHQTIFIAPTLEKKYDNHILHIGYTLNNDGKVKLLDKNNGFSHLRRNRNKTDNLSFPRKISGDDKYSLIANQLGATPPEYGF